MKDSGVKPPDGGYGWVVVASAFTAMGLTAAVLKNFGLFFLDIQRSFGVLTSTTSWVTSIAIAMFHLGAPGASVLSMRFSQRAVIMVGGCLSALGMVLASLGLSLPWIYLTMGLLQGLGISLSWISANSMVSHYFSRWRSIAYAIASSGECIFAIAFSPLFQWFIDTFTWQGALLLIGGLQLNLCVCGALMRPLKHPLTRSRSPALDTTDVPELGDSDVREQEEVKLNFQWSLLKKREMELYILFAVFAAVGFFILPLYLVPYASSLGLEPYWATSLLSVMALGDLMGRLTCGFLANARLIRNLQLLVVVVTLLGVVQLLLPTARSYAALLVFSSFSGLLFGGIVAIHVTSIIDVVGVDAFDSGLGLFMLLRSTGGFIGPPAAGWLVDRFGDFSSSFYLSGVCFIVSGIFVVLVDLLLQRKKAAGREQGLNPELHGCPSTKGDTGGLCNSGPNSSSEVVVSPGNAADLGRKGMYSA
ncbi:monocarboxylate transporter 13 [Scleropages formosus]|uniref:Zgc:114041 n=1 Tax=Scleropages formosus TaxID=113540 RepID=A0A8C9RCG5_SCLFO|nr:monocarboxylate transporter 13-like [Scleropages formosus]XP_018601999.1 monocarboxylate transporter 13-like [Scleropages formosus]